MLQLKGNGLHIEKDQWWFNCKEADPARPTAEYNKAIAAIIRMVFSIVDTLGIQQSSYSSCSSGPSLSHVRNR
jgi:hypothetical protein